MTNIVIIGVEPNNKASTRLASLLSKPPHNHTCTLLAESSSQSLMGYELIITTRITSTSVSAHQNILAAFNSGTPVICGFHQITTSGIGQSANNLVGKLGLASTVIASAGGENKTVTFISNKIQPYTTGEVVQTHTANDFFSYTNVLSLAQGATPIAVVNSAESEKCMLAIAKRSSLSLMGTPFPASCAYAGFLYSNYGEYTPNGELLIINLIKKVIELNQTATISGTSFNDAGDPELSDVYLYSHADGSLVSKTETGVDGSYSFPVPEGEFFVVCNNRNRDNNPQVVGYIKGVEL